MLYIKLLEGFILRSLFSKDEYNFKSKTFNPIKVFTILLLVLNLIFTVIIINKTSKVYTIIEQKCPVVFEELSGVKKPSSQLIREKKEPSTAPPNQS